jgi:hypothetical protein
LSAGSKAADKFRLYFTKWVCRLVPKQLTDLLAALEPADKKGLKNWAYVTMSTLKKCEKTVDFLTPHISEPNWSEAGSLKT